MAARLGASLCLRLLLLGCSVKLALVATSVFQETPVAEGASSTVQEAVGFRAPLGKFLPTAPCLSFPVYRRITAQLGPVVTFT